MKPCPAAVSGPEKSFTEPISCGKITKLPQEIVDSPSPLPFSGQRGLETPKLQHPQEVYES
jgi:hypothetical protein